MTRRASLISIAVMLVATFGANAQEGRLQRVRDEVNGSGSAKSESSDARADDSSDTDDAETSGELGRLLLLAPFYVPMELLQDYYEYRLVFARHPYVDGYNGYQIMLPEWAKAYYKTDTDGVPRKAWAVHLAIENGNDFDGLNRFQGHLKLEHASRWGFVTSWNYYREKMSGGFTDETVIGDANFTFRFAQNEVASMYAGLGIRVLTDRHQSDYGFNFTYGGDWFPTRPLIVSGVFDAGNLGSAAVVHGRASIGAILSGVEIFVGYDFLRIGSVNLQGPMAGCRLWL